MRTGCLLDALAPGLRARRFAVSLICAWYCCFATATLASSELERAQAEYDAAFARYTELVTEGGSGSVERAQADLQAALQRLQAAHSRSQTPRPAAPASDAGSGPAPAAAAEAAFQRGLAWYRGTDGPVDKPAAAREFGVAARAGHPRAQFNLGRMLWTGDGVPRDVPGGVQWMLKAAQAGQANAQFVIAQAYERGLGLPQDAALGLEWLQRSAAGGEPLAQQELGQRLIEGRGMAADAERGRALIAQAQAAGTAAASTAASAPTLDGERQAVLAALTALIDAQARGDASAMQAALATAHLTGEERQTLSDALARTAGKLALRELQIVPHAIGISGGGQWALLRYQYQFSILAGGEVTPQAGGNLALLHKEAGGWKVQQIVVDELLTLASFELPGNPALTQRGAAAAAACGARGGGLMQPQVVKDAMNQAVDQAISNWRVDETKIAHDAIFSAYGRVPFVGDSVANAYTVYERMKTLLVEVPADFKAGNAQAVMLDIILISWGGVQVVAEYVPGADNATDAIESALDTTRYNTVQRFNYLSLLRQLGKLDFSALPKYLVFRPVSREQRRLIEASLHGRTARQWHGRWPALQAIDVLDDQLLRASPRLVFSIGAEWAIARADSEAMFELARGLGASTPAATTPAEETAYIGLDLTRLALADRSSGDPVLGEFQLTAHARNLAWRLSCQRGTQILKVQLRDGSETQPVTVRNLPFSLIRAIGVGGSDTLEIAVDEQRTALHVDANLAPAPDGLEVRAPEILKSACVRRRLTGTDLIEAGINDEWPQATLNIKGRQAGVAALEFSWPASQELPAMTLPLLVNVHANLPAEPAATPAAPAATDAIDLECGYRLQRIPNWEGAADGGSLTLQRAKVSAKAGTCGWESTMTAQIDLSCNPLFGPADAAAASAELRKEDAEFEGYSWYAGSSFEDVVSGTFRGPLRTTRQNFEGGGWSGGYRPDGIGGQAHGFLFSGDNRVEISYSVAGSGCWDNSDKDWLIAQAAAAMAEARAVALGAAAPEVHAEALPGGPSPWTQAADRTLRGGRVESASPGERLQVDGARE